MLGRLIGRKVQWNLEEVATIEFLYHKPNKGLQRAGIDCCELYAIVRRPHGQLVEVAADRLKIFEESP